MSRERRSKLDPLSRIITLGDIDCIEVNEIIQDIYEINDEDRKRQTVEPIKLIINSFGGEVFSGLALIDVIDSSQTPIHTICHGSAMSMALIVYAAGHHRIASKYATFMYHEAAYELNGKVAFHKQELKETERIDKICDAYLISKSKFTQKVLQPHRDRQAEWYFDVKTAQRYGLVDEILE
jgi:ATP-dependent Clp protease protease subunit